MGRNCTERWDIWIGHLLQRHDSLLLKTIRAGWRVRMPSKGRSGLEYIDEILEDEDTSCPRYTGMKRLAEDCKTWRAAANHSTL